MNRIFISYRREDSEGFARSLYQSLAEEFGEDTVFMDVEAIELGVDFVEAIDKSLDTCGAFLVLIGKEWAACIDERGKRRLEDPDDFVRLEIARAIKRNVRLIPILIKGAKMPKVEELPDDLQPIIRRQALELRHDQWKYDIEHLINVLRKCLDLHPVKKGPDISRGSVKEKEDHVIKPKPAKKVVLTATTITIAAILVIVIGVWLFHNLNKPSQEDISGEILNVFPEDKDKFKEAEIDRMENMEVYQAVSEFKIRKVQESLAALGYDLGIIDGKIGPKTVAALKSFQSSMRLHVNGKISDEIINILDSAVQKHTEAKNELLNQKKAIPSDPRIPSEINLNGVWYDEDKIAYDISQKGNTFYVKAFDPVLGLLIFNATGTINGRELEYSFQSVGAEGVGRGTVSPNNRIINFSSMDSYSGIMESGQLYR